MTGNNMLQIEGPKPKGLLGRYLRLLTKCIRLQYELGQKDVEIRRLKRQLAYWLRLKEQAYRTRDALLDAAREERYMRRALRRATSLDMPPNYSFAMSNEEDPFDDD